MRSKTFSRFKYAEEFAHAIDDTEGVTSWKLYRAPDALNEDGYETPVYIVEYEET